MRKLTLKRSTEGARSGYKEKINARRVRGGDSMNGRRIGRWDAENGRERKT